LNIAIAILGGIVFWAAACAVAFAWQTWQLTGRIW
jgi:hypothetical protein